MSKREVLHALRSIAIGKEVMRSRHDLTYEGADLTDEFIKILIECGFRRCKVSEVAVAPGVAVAAFLVKDSVAWFGWVFLEKFTETKRRKLWGSVVKNKKGDWLIELPERSPEFIFANTQDTMRFDEQFPP